MLREKRMTEDPTALFDNMGSLIVVLAVITLPVGMVCVMLNDYKHYRESHWQQRFRLVDFIKQEQLYIYLFLLMIFLIIGELLFYSVM